MKSHKNTKKNTKKNIKKNIKNTRKIKGGAIPIINELIGKKKTSSVIKQNSQTTYTAPQINGIYELPKRSYDYINLNHGYHNINPNREPFYDFANQELYHQPLYDLGETAGEIAEETSNEPLYNLASGKNVPYQNTRLILKRKESLYNIPKFVNTPNY